MVSVSAIIKRIVNQKPLLQEGLRQGIINYAAFGERIKRDVEKELAQEVRESAIIMALRRHGETLRQQDVKKIKFSPETQLTLKTGLSYFSVKRSAQLFGKLEMLYREIDYEAGDTLNLIHGNNELSIITGGKSEPEVLRQLNGERISTKEKNLVSISMSLDRSFTYTPGIIFAVTRKLYWDNVNIFELVTTATELILIFQKKDVMRAYTSLEELLEEKRKN